MTAHGVVSMTCRACGEAWVQHHTRGSLCKPCANRSVSQAAMVRFSLRESAVFLRTMPVER